MKKPYNREIDPLERKKKKKPKYDPKSDPSRKDKKYFLKDISSYN